MVPEAVVFHAEASSRGNRRTPLTGSHIWRGQPRQAALYTMLVNGSVCGSCPGECSGSFLGSLLRAVGFLLVRAPGEAFDEMAALLSTYPEAAPHRDRRGSPSPHRVTVPAPPARSSTGAHPPGRPTGTDSTS